MQYEWKIRYFSGGQKIICKTIQRYGVVEVEQGGMERAGVRVGLGGGG